MTPFEQGLWMAPLGKWRKGTTILPAKGRLLPLCLLGTVDRLLAFPLPYATEQRLYPLLQCLYPEGLTAME